MDALALLKSHGLRETTFRKKALEAFSAQHAAVDLEQLRRLLPEETDRITLYRTLQHFEKSGLIHSIADAEGGVKYALCHADCDTQGHHDSHAHFTCTRCQTTLCLEDWQLPNLIDARIATIQSADLLIKGICSKCAA